MKLAAPHYDPVYQAYSRLGRKLQRKTGNCCAGKSKSTKGDTPILNFGKARLEWVHIVPSYGHARFTEFKSTL